MSEEEKLPDYNGDFKRHFEELGRDMLREYHDQLLPAQLVLFNRMYGSIEKIPFDKMAWAYYQVRRTVDFNNKKKK